MDWTNQIAAVTVVAMILSGGLATLSAGDVVQDSAILTAQNLNKILCAVRKATTTNVIRAVVAQHLNAGTSDIPVHSYWAQSTSGKHYFSVPVDASRDLIFLMFVKDGEYLYLRTDTRLQLNAFARANASGWLALSPEDAAAVFNGQLGTWKNYADTLPASSDCR